jgi:hypothetical protein
MSLTICTRGGGVEGRLYMENSIFEYGANSGQRVTRPCSSGKNFELILLRIGKFYSFDKIHG